MTPSGTLTTLVSFNGGNGRWPVAALVQGSDGGFYGTTVRGGTEDVGTIFKLMLPFLSFATPIVSNQVCSVVLTNLLGRAAVAEASTNLVDWVPLYTNSTTGQFQDDAPATLPLRFYRARVLP
jgi:uncharacterized repeat protein (TIGR03803 family)